MLRVVNNIMIINRSIDMKLKSIYLNRNIIDSTDMHKYYNIFLVNNVNDSSNCNEYIIKYCYIKIIIILLTISVYNPYYHRMYEIRKDTDKILHK